MGGLSDIAAKTTATIGGGSCQRKMVQRSAAAPLFFGWSQIPQREAVMRWETLELLTDTLIISADVLVQPSISVTPAPMLRPHGENFIIEE